MTIEQTMRALRRHEIGAVSLYASWKTGVGADVCVQETDDGVWHGVGRLGFDPLVTDGPYVSRGHPKALEILRAGLTPALLLRLPDRPTPTFGPGWILQALDDGTFSFKTTALDPLPCGPRALLDAMASLRATETREVPLSPLESGHLRLAQAAVGVCPAVLDSLRHHPKADGANTPRVLTWPGVAAILPDAPLPREAWRPRAVRLARSQNIAF